MKRWKLWAATYLVAGWPLVALAQDAPPAEDKTATEAASDDTPAEDPPLDDTSPATDDKPPEDDKPADPAKAEIAALVAKQNAVADEYNAIIQGIKKQDEMAALELELAELKRALAAAEAGDPDLADARGAQRAAIKARQALIELKINENPEGAKGLAQLKKLKAEQAALQWDAALARFRIDSPLSPISRALAVDEELGDLQAKVKAATAEEKADAQAAYEKRRQEKIADMEEGKMLLAEAEEASEAADRISQTLVLVEERLAPIRKAVEESTGADVAEAQAAVNSALGKGSLKELRGRQAATIEKYNTRVKELIAADANATKLKSEHEALGKQIRELKKQAAKP